MALDPPSDIVLDVARAADPSRYEAAVEKLTSLAPSFSVRFSEVLETMNPASPYATEVAEGARGMANLRDALRQSETATTLKSKNAFQQFEAFFLQSFVQMMLPQDATATFGRGAAGDFWKSLLAENLGKELAAAGGIGIADQLSKPRLAEMGRSAEEQGSASQWASNLPYLDSRFPDLLSDAKPTSRLDSDAGA